MVGITRDAPGFTKGIREEHDLGALEQQSVQNARPSSDSRFRQVWNSTGDTFRQLKDDLRSQAPTARSLGAMAGHVTQQLITCGATTLAREEVFMHAYNAMLPALEGHAKWALLGAQGVASLINVGGNMFRQDRLHRLEDLDSTANVRGQFGLSPQQWQSKSDKEKQRLTDQHHIDSRNVTRNAVVAEVGYMVMSGISLAKGDGALAARVLATQLRNLTYAGTRETLQASINLTTGVDGKATHGLNESNMAANGWTYTAMTLAMGYLQDAVISRTLPAGQSVAGPALMNSQGQPLKGQELTDSINLVAGIRGLANTAVEFMDALRGKHYDLKQVGDEQRLQTDLKKLLPLKDYERLVDHSPARLSWNNISNATVLAASEIANLITQGKMPEGATQLLNNLGTAAMFGMTYKSVNGIYGAHAANRGAIRAAKSGQTQNLESGSGVPITMRPRDGGRDPKPLEKLPTIPSLPSSELMMSGANGPGPSTPNGEDLSSSSAAGPGPATQANTEARLNSAAESLKSAARSGSGQSVLARNSLEANGASMQSLIDAQVNTDTSRAAVRAGKQPQRPPERSALPTQATTVAHPTAVRDRASTPEAPRTGSASAPRLPPITPQPDFLEEFAEILKPKT
jgi:hypothetical protein